MTTVLRRDPTTARHGYFWLLGRPPGPVRTSLDNLATPDSSRGPILMPGLVRTPDQHRPPQSRAPALKESTNPCLRVAGLQEPATTPSDGCTCGAASYFRRNRKGYGLKDVDGDYVGFGCLSCMCIRFTDLIPAFRARNCNLGTSTIYLERIVKIVAIRCCIIQR